METINLELSKRLAPYLENEETEYCYIKKTILKKDFFKVVKVDYKDDEESNYVGIDYWICKTLTLEEAIEFLPKTFGVRFDKDNPRTCLKIYFIWSWNISYSCTEYIWKCTIELHWKTLLEAIEKMLEYLLDNNLLWNLNTKC